MSKLVVGFIIVFNVLMLMGLVVIPSSPISSEYEQIILFDSGEDVFIYRLDSRGLSDIHSFGTQTHKYTNMIIDDLDNNGNKEWIGSKLNREIISIDPITLETIWSFDMTTLGLISKDMKAGDFNGDGYKELIANHFGRVVVGSEDLATFMLSHKGELMQIFPSQSESVLGSNKISVDDFDKDGSDELVISYGDVLFDYQNYTGAYLLQYWDWNDSTSRMEKIWETGGLDQGGNVDLDYLIHDDGVIFLTIGWYNNPLRAFDEYGNTLWTQNLTITGEYNKYSGREMHLYRDYDGIHHLYITDYAYSEQETISWFDLDPFSGGNISDPITYTNATGTIQFFEKDFAVIQVISHDDIASRDISHYYAYSLPERIFLGSYPNYSGNSFNARGNTIDIILVNGMPAVLKLDDETKLGLFTLNSAILLSQRVHRSIGSSTVAIIDEELDKLTGDYVFEFPNYIRAYLFIVLILNITLLLAIILKPKIEDYWANRKFGIDWKFAVLKRLHQMLGEENKLITAPDKLIGRENEVILDYYQARPSMDSPTMDQFKIWMDKVGRNALSLQTSDIAVLIEIAFLSSVSTVSEIHEKLSQIPKSTIYRRVDKLYSMGLIQFADDLNKHGEITITSNGELFLKALYLSLKAYYSNL